MNINNEFKKYVGLVGGIDKAMTQLGYSRSMVYKTINGERYPSKAKAREISRNYPEVSFMALMFAND